MFLLILHERISTLEQVQAINYLSDTVNFMNSCYKSNICINEKDVCIYVNDMLDKFESSVFKLIIDSDDFHIFFHIKCNNSKIIFSSIVMELDFELKI